MTTLTLTKLWINRMDTGEAFSAYSSERSRAHSVEGEVRTYAGGRQRAVYVAGERGEFPFKLINLTAAEVEIVRGWTGLTVQIRDHRGQRFFGAYFEVAVEEVKAPVVYNVQATLRVLTVTEGV